MAAPITGYAVIPDCRNFASNFQDMTQAGNLNAKEDRRDSETSSLHLKQAKCKSRYPKSFLEEKSGSSKTKPYVDGRSECHKWVSQHEVGN